MKFLYILLLLPLGLFLNVYYSVPNSVHLTKNSYYSLKLNNLCNISSNAVAVSGNTKAFYKKNGEEIVLNTDNEGSYSLDIKMLNLIPVKKVDITVAPEYSVIPSGSPIGIKIFSQGLLVVNISEVKTEHGSISPAADAGIKIGDRIISANGKKLKVSEELSGIINNSQGEITLEILRNNTPLSLSLNPQKVSDDNSKKIGIWVRDSTAGVGTLTFFDPKSSTFATLGHAITDIDTGDIISPRTGTISRCEISYTTKSTTGAPGELSGVFKHDCLGNIVINSPLGIYGRTTDTSCFNNPGYMPVATRFQIKEGAGYIMADVDGNGVKKYAIEIESVSKEGGIDNKGLVIHITDPELLEKTGGIVQGMSGSPVIQNGRLIGAVTHVFVNDPTRGYGIFAENMLDEAMKIK